jgi:hypothetical protein
MLLLLALASGAAAPSTPPIATTCAHGCALVASACNASDPTQAFQLRPYSAAHEDALSLAGTDLCASVKASGTKPGDEVWLTACHAEHPDHANRNWTLDGTRCNTARGNYRIAPGESDRQVVLEPCRSSNAPVTSGRSAAQPRSSWRIREQRTSQGRRTR